MREPGHALEPVNFLLANTIYHLLMGKMSSFDRGVKRARFVVLKEACGPGGADRRRLFDQYGGVR